MRKLMRLGSACLLLVVLVLLVVPVQAAPPTQNPEGDAVDPNTPLNSSVQGTVINWGYRSEPDMHVMLTGAGWTLEAITASGGNFIFDNLGEGAAVLNPIFPKGSDLKAMTTDLAVPFFGPARRTVNLGIYGGEGYPTGLPLTIRMEPSASKVGAGEMISFTVTISNNMPNDIHQVFVTDMFPPELTPTDITTSVGNAWVGGKLAAADLGNLTQGEGATVVITAKTDLNLGDGDIVTNRAGVFYAESVALQAEIKLNDTMVKPDTLPETGSQMVLPLAAAVVLIGAIVGLRRLRLTV